MHLQALLPRLLPQAAAWTEGVAADVAVRGMAQILNCKPPQYKPGFSGQR